MKIAFDVSAAVYGTGVSDYTIDLVSKLPPQDLLLFGSSLRRQHELKNLFPSAKILPFPPRFLHHLWNQLHIINIERLVGKFDVLHSSDWTQPPTVAKTVTTVHDLSPFLYPSQVHPRIVRVHAARMKWVVKECDQIIAVSQTTANDLTSQFTISPSKLSVIYEALPSRYLLRPAPCNLEPYVVTIGARQPRKNIDRLILAVLNFKSHYRLPEKLIVIGENIGQVVDPSITYTNYVDNQRLVDLLAGAQVLVYPSLYEGFGLPILGAFHHHVPVACSDIPVFHETAGTAAIYFNPTDEESIASSIAIAIKTKHKLISLGTNQLAKFSWQTAADQTMDVYKSLV